MRRSCTSQSIGQKCRRRMRAQLAWVSEKHRRLVANFAINMDSNSTYYSYNTADYTNGNKNENIIKASEASCLPTFRAPGHRFVHHRFGRAAVCLRLRCLQHSA